MKRNQIIAGGVALVIALGAAFFGYKSWQKRKHETQLAQLVNDAGAQLEANLGVNINAPAPDLLPKLDKAIEQTEVGLNQIRSGPGDPLAEAADDYVGLVLGVLKRQAGAARGRLKFNESHKVLAAHLAQVGQRGNDWMPKAIQLRQALDKDYFDYQIAASSLANMLRSYPESRKKIAARLPAAPLPAEAAVKEAREKALAAAEATRQELEKAKQLVAPG